MFFILVCHFIQRQTITADALAHRIERFLDRNRVDFAEQCMDVIQVLLLDFQGSCLIAIQPLCDKLMRFLRVGVCEDADDTGAAERHDRNDHVIVAAEHDEVITQETGDAYRKADISAGFLDSDDVRMLGETFHRRNAQRAAGSSRYVVKNDRCADRIRNGCEVADHALFICLVVIRCDRKQCIGAHVRIPLAFH